MFIEKSLTFLATLAIASFTGNFCMEMDIFDAIRTNNGARVQELVTHDPAIVNRVSRRVGHGSEGRTPLQQAASKGRRNIAEFLISHGANIHQQSMSGMTALHYAAIQGNQAITRLLLEHGANVNQPGVENLCIALGSSLWALFMRQHFT